MDPLIPGNGWRDGSNRFIPNWAAAAAPTRFAAGCAFIACSYSITKSDPGMDDLLREVESVRCFAGLRLAGAIKSR